MFPRRKKLIATAALFTMIAFPLATGGAAFAQSTTGGSTAGGSSTAGSSSTGGKAAKGTGTHGAGFTDVKSGTAHERSIIELAALGIVNGFPDGSYQPAANVTRAEFAKVIDIALGLQAAAQGDKSASQFSDVPAGQWYTGYVDVAAAKGIVSGFPNGTFQPNAPVEYDQAVTMIVRALGYAPNVVGSWPSGYMAEAADIQNAAGQDDLLSGLSNPLSQAMDRADVARLVANMLYAVPAAQSFRLTSGTEQITTTTPTNLRDQAAQIGYNLYYPGNSQGGAPVSGCYGNVVTGTLMTNAVLNPNQVQIASLPTGSCGTSPVAGTTSSTYTLAPSAGIVGSVSLMNLTGYQVSFATNKQGQIVFLDPVTPASDALVGASLGTQLTITPSNGLGQLPSGVSPIAVEAGNASTYQNYDVAPGAIAMPPSGTFQGSDASNDTVTAILNPNGDIISLVDTSQLPHYKDVYLTGIMTLNGVQTVQFLVGSPSPTSLAIAPGVVVTIDGKPASISDLKAGMVLKILMNGQSQATAIKASDKTVTGTLGNATIQTTGNSDVSINGKQYQVNMGSAVLAQDGKIVSGVSQNTLDGLTNDTVTAYLGTNGHIGYLNVASANTVVGMALSNASTGMVEVESGAGQVVAYPVGGNPTVNPGDIVRITLNPAGGSASITDYAPGYGTVADPAVVTGVLGSELQFATTTCSGTSCTFGGKVYDGFLASDTPVFQGSGGGGYDVTNLNPATLGSAGIATTAGTATPTVLAPGNLILVGMSGSGVVKAVTELNNDGYYTFVSPGTTSWPDSVNPGSTSVTGSVDVAVLTATSATNGSLGTAQVLPMGATSTVQVSVESSGDTVNTGLGNNAGTNLSIFQLNLMGGSLVPNSSTQSGTGGNVNNLTTTPGNIDGGSAAGDYFCGVTSANGDPAINVDATAGCANPTTINYGAGTVVLNVPNANVEPVGSLVLGQQVYVFGETLPNLGSAPGGELAEFIEVVGTATSSGTTSANTGGYAVTANISAQVGTIPAPCGGGTVACAVYAVSGQVTDNGSGVSGANVIVSLPSGSGDALSTAVNSDTGQAMLNVQTASDGGYSLYLDVPETAGTPSTVSLTITYVDPTGTTHSPQTEPSAPVD